MLESYFKKKLFGDFHGNDQSRSFEPGWESKKSEYFDYR
jgi:hypothetical protein